MSIPTHVEAIARARSEPSSTAWFWWKEIRQLAPLAILLAVVSVLVLVIHQLTASVFPSLRVALPDQVFILVLPGLFATGAGPVLVSQERTLRTLDWLSLLPISARRLAFTKFSVSLAGLAAMWLFAACVVMLFALSPNNASWEIGGQIGYSGNPLSYPVWIVHSVFVLVCGFYTAWRIRSPFYSLAALIPLAFAPMLATSVLAAIENRPLMSRELDYAVFWMTLLGIGIVAPLTYRAAMKALGPQTAPKPRLEVTIPHRTNRGNSVDATAPRFSTEIAPLVWQFFHASRGTLLILSAMLLASFFNVMWIDWMYEVDRPGFRGHFGPLNFLLGLLAPIATCWLGVVVFKNDGSIERIRFLADRGIRPGRVFVARQLVPLAVLSLGLCVYAIWLLALRPVASWDPNPVQQLSFLSVALSAWIFFSVSQWVSQMVRTLILAVILAPLIAVIVFAWLIFVHSQLAFPLVGVLLCSLVPLLATRLTMKRYLDARDRPMTLWCAVGVVILMVGIPIGHAANHVMRVPGMTSSKRDSLYQEAKQYFDEARQARVTTLLFGYPAVDRDPETGEPFNETQLLAYLTDNAPSDPFDWLQTLQDLREDPSLVLVEAGHYEAWQWRSRFLLAKLKWLQSEDADGFATFRPWIEASGLLLRATRKSRRLNDQEVADQIEYTLIETIQSDEMKPHLDDEVVQATIRRLGTPDSRATARRQALLASWYGAMYAATRQSDPRHVTELPITETEPPGLIFLLQRRHYESFVLAALEGIDACRAERASDNWRRQIQSIYQPGAPFESSAFGDRIRALPAGATDSGYAQLVPTTLWGRDWEYVSFETASPSDEE